jgi:zinc finger SWIM domain-containing protein 3
MTFASEEAAFMFYNKYAKDHGFSIRREKVKREKGPSGKIRYRRFRCSRAGKRESKYLTMDGRSRR